MSTLRSPWLILALAVLSACGGGGGGPPPPPAAPVIASASPASPANQNAPVLSGTSVAGAAIAIYATAACTGTPVATATATAAGTFTVAVAVPDDTQTTFRATAEVGGATSACGAGFLYVEDSTPPAAPAAVATAPASPSSQNQPVVSGSAEAGATVRVFTSAACAGTAAATGTATGGAFAIATTVASDAATTFGLVAVDAAGNASACAAGPTYVEDSTPPAAPVVLATAPPSPSNATTIQVSGTAEAGAAVTLHADAACGAVLGTATAAGDGAWSIGTAVALNATTSFHARAVDAAGNASACSPGLAFVQDSTLPATPQLTAPASPSSSNTVLLTGTTDAGATVRLFDGTACVGAPVATTTAGPGGAFSFTRTVPSDATASWVAAAVSAAGNVSACSAPATYVEDSTPPAAPSAAAVTPAGPANQNLPAVSGSAEAGATVRVFTSAACAGVAAATGTAAGGTFSIATAVGNDTTTTFGLVAVDAAGNASACAAGPTYVEDSTPPAAPAVLATAPPSPSNATTIQVSGTAEGGATVTLHLDGACAVAAGTAVAGPGGAWAITAVVPQNATTTLRARAADAAGNASACSAGLAFVQDSTLPATPTLAAPASPSSSNTVLLTGTTDAGVTVRLFDGAACGGAPAATTTAGPGGAFSFTRTVPSDATSTWSAAAVSAAGNVSGCSTPVSYVEDSTPPAAPVAAAVAPAGPANQNQPTVSGSAEAGAGVQLFTSATCAGAPAASGTATGGAFSLSVTVPDDSTTAFGVVAVDAAGNASPCAAGPTYVEDSTAPATPAVAATTPASPSSAAAIQASGTAEAGSTVTLHADAACGPVLGTSTAAANGTWSIAATVAENATTTLRARATDAAGNASACSAGLAYVEDSTAPATPTLAAPPSPSSVNDIQLTGTAEAGATVQLFTGIVCVGLPDATATAGAGGFAFPVTVAADATTTWVAAAVDAAGNVSGCSAPALYVEDSTPPATPVAAAVDPASPANENLPVVSGSAEAGSTVRVFTSATCAGAPAGSGTATAGGTYAVGAPVADDTTTTFGVVALDAAGNASACAAGPTYVEDSTPPATPAVTATTPASPSSIATVQASGTAEAGSTVTLHADAACGASLGSVVAGAGGTWAVATVVAENATTTFHARATDAAGNASACSPGLAYVEDSLPPAAPALATSPASPSNQAALAVTGTTEPSASVSLFPGGACGGAPVASATADAAGAFSIPRTVAANSSTTWSASASDAAGNASACSAPITYVEDEAPPAAPVLAATTTPASPANDPTPLVSGTAEPLATIRFYATAGCTGAPLATTAATAGGTFSALVPAGLNTTTTFRATAADAAGNASGCADGPSYVHDDIPPTFAGLVSAAGVGAGSIQLTWAAASDGGTPPAQIRYDICQSATSAGCTTAFTATATVTGVTTATRAVAAGTRAFFLVRARDLLGNRDGNTVVKSAKTLGDGVAAVASGAGLTCVLDSAGGVACTGDNARGQLGNGVFDVGGGTQVVNLPPAAQVSAGERHVCALAQDGGVWCWGDNVDGEVGQDVVALPRVNVATQVTLPLPARSVACGRRFSCALLADGTERCWGFNDVGQLGASSAPALFSSTPLQVTGLTDAVAIAPGESHGCALTAGGVVRCWGAGGNGQLGQGTGLDSATPVTFGATVPAATGFKALAAGWRHTCALTADGVVYCAGENRLGQVGAFFNPGNGNLVDQLAPVVAQPGLPGDVSAIALGASHSCALSDSGQPSCWGEDRFEQLGDGAGGVDQASAVPVSGTGWPTLTASHEESCLIEDGVARCWGTGGFAADVPVPTALGGARPEQAIALAAGRDHTCAHFSDGEVRCFGAGTSGQLGGGQVADANQPTDGAVGAGALLAGGDVTCFATAAGRSCFGANGFGQLRDATLIDRATPVAPQPGWPIAVADHACAVDQSTGAVLCWGRNDRGQLGIGITSASAPANAVPVLPTPAPVRAITAGAAHACALLRDGTVGCWGDQTLGQLGDPGVTGLRAERGVVPGLSGVAEVDAGGGDTTCARLASGAVLCWGANGSGQVGDGTTTPRGAPTPVTGISTAIDVAVGPDHACAALADGTVRCWGANATGALGDGTTVGKASPVTVSGLTGARKVVVGAGHSCALTADGRALCWGGNARGQLGDGTNVNRTVPVPLAAYP